MSAREPDRSRPASAGPTVDQLRAHRRPGWMDAGVPGADPQWSR